MSLRMPLLALAAAFSLVPTTAAAEEIPDSHVLTDWVSGDACSNPESGRLTVKNISLTYDTVNVWVCLEDSAKGTKSFFLTQIAKGETNTGAFVCNARNSISRVTVCTGDDYNCPKPC